MKAAEETVRTNNPSFKYIDSILNDWFNKGVKNKEEAVQALKEHDNKNQDNKGTEPKKQATNKKRIRRIDDRDWEKMLGID
jgi:DNA replication protein DnaD